MEPWKEEKAMIQMINTVVRGRAVPIVRAGLGRERPTLGEAGRPLSPPHVSPSSPRWPVRRPSGRGSQRMALCPRWPVHVTGVRRGPRQGAGGCGAGGRREAGHVGA